MNNNILIRSIDSLTNKTAIRKSNGQVVKVKGYISESDMYYCEYVQDKELLNSYIQSKDLIFSELVDALYV